MTLSTAIANHLSVTEQAIIRVEEWASCLFAVVKGLGGRFIPKKIKQEEASMKEIKRVKMLEGDHLTATEVKHIKAILNQGMTSGQVRNKQYFFSQVDNKTYDLKLVQIKKDDYGRKLSKPSFYKIQVS